VQANRLCILLYTVTGYRTATKSHKTIIQKNSETSQFHSRNLNHYFKRICGVAKGEYWHFLVRPTAYLFARVKAVAFGRIYVKFDTWGLVGKYVYKIKVWLN
jgi:hypothetical protein